VSPSCFAGSPRPGHMPGQPNHGLPWLYLPRLNFDTKTTEPTHAVRSRRGQPCLSFPSLTLTP
jgi:hypothetical protein